MKCIYPDCISSISADEENADYPVDNLLDEHPKKVWKGESRDAIVTAVITAGGALVVFATNATSVSLVISSGQSISWAGGISWDSGISWDTSGDSDVSETTLLSGEIDGVAWWDFAAARTSNFTAIISLTADAGKIIQAGIVRCGTANAYRDPNAGIREGLRDYSIVKELSNGATYIRKRDVVRTFEFDLWEDRDTDFYLFMLDVSRALGPEPMPWRIMDTVTDEEWIVFARFDRMPGGAHDLPAQSRINISLLEVL